MVNLKILFAVLALASVYMPELAFAQESTSESTGSEGSGAGASLKQDIVAVFQGDLGFLVGLAISVFGLYTWLIKQASWGIVLLIAGGLVTVFPDLFDNIASGSKTAFGSSISDN